MGQAKAIKSPITLLITGTQVDHWSLKQAQLRDMTDLKLLSYLQAQSETELEELVLTKTTPRKDWKDLSPVLAASAPLITPSATKTAKEVFPGDQNTLQGGHGMNILMLHPPLILLSSPTSSTDSKQ